MGLLINRPLGHKTVTIANQRQRQSEIFTLEYRGELFRARGTEVGFVNHQYPCNCEYKHTFGYLVFTFFADTWKRRCLLCSWHMPSFGYHWSRLFGVCLDLPRWECEMAQFFLLNLFIEHIAYICPAYSYTQWSLANTRRYSLWGCMCFFACHVLYLTFLDTGRHDADFFFQWTLRCAWAGVYIRVTHDKCNLSVSILTKSEIFSSM